MNVLHVNYIFDSRELDFLAEAECSSHQHVAFVISYKMHFV